MAAPLIVRWPMMLKTPSPSEQRPAPRLSRVTNAAAAHFSQERQEKRNDMFKRKFELFALLFCTLLFASACKKKVAALPPPPALPAAKESAPPLKPVISSFAASPAVITRGASSTLELVC